MELIKTYNEENLFKTEFTGSGMVILVLLVLALIALGERLLYDLARVFAAPIGDYGYFNNPKVIIVHSIFVVSLLIISIIVNYVFGRKREKYALVLIPYFVMSIALAIQLAIELGVYFTGHHNNLQFYLVMSLLVVISSYGIFHIQNNYKKIQNTDQANSTGILTIFVLVFALFAILILSFNIPETQNNNSQFYPSPGNIQVHNCAQEGNCNNSSSGSIGADITGNYVFDFEYQGTDNYHDVNLKEDSFGNLSGGGGNPAGRPHTFEWIITSGTASDNNLSFVANYTAPSDAVNPQTIMYVNGTISENGTISGSWSDNYRGQSRSGSFVMN